MYPKVKQRQHQKSFFAYIGKKEVIPMGRLVINGEEIYELDEDCMREKREKERAKRRCYAPEDKKKPTPPPKRQVR